MVGSNEKVIFVKNGLSTRIYYVSNTFADTVMRLINKNHLTGRNRKNYVIRKLKLYKGNKPVIKNNNV